MKRKTIGLLLAALMLGTLVVPAAADDTVTASGFYSIGTAAGVTITPQNDAGPVAAVSADVNDDGNYETFYPGSVKLKVTLTGTTEGRNYFLYLINEQYTGDQVPTKEQFEAANALRYVNQKAAGTTLTFDGLDAVYPDPAKFATGEVTNMTLFITSDDTGFAMKRILVSYAPSKTYPLQPYAKGDVDMDEEITISDAIMTLEASVEIIILTPQEFALADVDGDEEITISDALWILEASLA